MSRHKSAQDNNNNGFNKKHADWKEKRICMIDQSRLQPVSTVSGSNNIISEGLPILGRASDDADD